jgi:Tat protein secretion system quality control protein TatD with DNase activity
VHLREVLRVLANIVGETEERVAIATTKNAERLFGL